MGKATPLSLEEPEKYCKCPARGKKGKGSKETKNVYKYLQRNVQILKLGTHPYPFWYSGIKENAKGEANPKPIQRTKKKINKGGGGGGVVGGLMTS